jgi:RNA polymerase subunit RPABC4/transcription elongation factor Spt4
LTNTPSDTQEEIIAFEPIEIELYFNILCEGFQKGELTFNQIRETLKDFMLYDREGNLWTIGAKSGKWYRWENNKWQTADTPEGPLFSAYRIEEKLAELNRTCPNCEKLVDAEYRFCPYCGTALENPQPAKVVPKGNHKPAAPATVFCRNCGKKIKVQAKFCNYCGAPRR